MKRLLVFLALLALGILALRLAIGDEGAVRANTEPTNPDVERPRPGGVQMQGKIGASVSQTGAIEFPQYKTVPQADGSIKHERVFVLKAEDSKPLDAGLQELDRVEVQLFEAEQPSARVTARQAFVELSRDASGRPSLREQKEIDLRDAVFESLPGSKMAGLRLELGNAKIRVADDEILLHTATDLDPVLLVMAGQRSGTLRGKGLQARLPRDRNSRLRRTDIEILHEPILETDGVVVRADGRLRYVEDMASGAAQVTLDDKVRLDLARGAASLDEKAASSAKAPGRDGARIRGDQFTGWLQRNKQRKPDGQESEQLAWQRLLLTGAPACAELDAGRVLTPRISVLPGPFGEPFLVTAHGGESRIEQTQVRTGARQTDPVVSTSARPVHLIRPGNSVSDLYRSFGFPHWTLRPLNELQIVVFEGSAHVEEGARVVDAQKGLQVFHREGEQGGVARGFGDVRLTQRALRLGEQDLVATGNDGFRLLATDTFQRLRMGPPAPADVGDPAAPWRTHRYDVRQGASQVEGVGACEVDLAGERTVLRLFSPGPHISARLAAQDVQLIGVRRLDAQLEGRELVQLDAAGLPARATLTRDREVVLAEAPRIERIGPRSLRLAKAPPDDPLGLWTGMPESATLPVLTRTSVASGTRPGGTVRVEGPRIDVHHLGGSDVLVEAVELAGERPLASVRVEDQEQVTTATFHARRLQAVPFLLTREMQRVHAAGAVDPLAGIPFHSLGKPWLLVDDVRDFHLEDPRYGLVEGSGDRLLLSQGAEAGLFVGDPDSLAPAQVTRIHEGSLVTTRGARVRIFRDEDVRMQALRTFADRPTFVLPSVTLHQPGTQGLLSHMTASCQGNIDVLPDAVVFQGPVSAQGLQPDGSEDPDGVHLDAGELRMLRHVDTGRIVRVVGRDVRIEWAAMKAGTAELELDLRWNTLVARDQKRAWVVLPDSRTFTAPRIEVNYDTMAVRCFHGRMVQNRESGAVDQ